MILIDDDFIDQKNIDDFYNAVILDNNPTWQSTGMIHGNRDLEQSFDNEFRIKNWTFSKDFQFCRVLPDFGTPSFDFGVVDEQAKKIFLTFCNKHNVKPEKILRAKINFTWPSNDDRRSPHVDATYPHKVFLYYLNDNDGPTIFYDKDCPLSEEYEDIDDSIIVMPKAGRAILFDGLRFHSPISPKNGVRFTLNVTFV